MHAQHDTAFNYKVTYYFFHVTPGQLTALNGQQSINQQFYFVLISMWSQAHVLDPDLNTDLSIFSWAFYKCCPLNTLQVNSSSDLGAKSGLRT